MALHFVWLESKQDAIASQLVTIGDNLFAQSDDGTKNIYGITPAEIATWRQGAAINGYLQLRLIPAVRDYSGGLTAARDELQLDQSVVPFVIPPFSAPAPPAPISGCRAARHRFSRLGRSPLPSHEAQRLDPIRRQKFGVSGARQRERAQPGPHATARHQHPD